MLCRVSEIFTKAAVFRAYVARETRATKKAFRNGDKSSRFCIFGLTEIAPGVRADDFSAANNSNQARHEEEAAAGHYATVSSASRTMMLTCGPSCSGVEP
jgi:hypothetical protein